MANIMGKFKSILKQPEDEVAYDDFYDDTEAADTADSEESYQEPEDTGDDSSAGNNVMNINAGASVQFVLFKPETFDKDITAMADEFIKRNTVILNMEQTNKDVGKRIIDFLSGVAYAHSGKISRVAEDTYIVMPSNVRLSGEDIMDEVESDNIYF